MRKKISAISFYGPITLLVSILLFTTGCGQAAAPIPDFTIKLEQAPVVVSAEQLHSDYTADKEAANIKYKGKEVWVREAIVDFQLDSDSGSQLMVQGYRLRAGTIGFSVHPFAFSTIMIDSQLAEELIEYANSESRFTVDLIGICHGVLEGVDNRQTGPVFDAVANDFFAIPTVILVEIKQITSVREAGAPPLPIPGY